jgi:sortase A
MKTVNKKYILLSLLLILTGFTIIMYPTLNDKYMKYKQNKLLSIWEETSKNILTINDSVNAEYNFTSEDLSLLKNSTKKSIVNYIKQFYNRLKILDEKEKQRKETALIKQKRIEYINIHMEGKLIINKINLSLPILKNTTKSNLNLSVASIKGTGKPWLKGNYGIAGHRNHTFGRNFNRLDELVIGDIIKVIDLKHNEYIYKISQKLIVNESDIWVLKDTPYKKEITLVTCHPIHKKHPKTRLVIKGTMVN